jgi:mRNA interferase RelE/StbE
MALSFDPDAFDVIPKSEQKRLLAKCEWLWSNRRVVTHIPLREDLNPLCGWRVGDYRIIYSYEPETDEMVIRLVGHRRDIYERARRRLPRGPRS